MCYNCGCGMPDDDHGDPRNITNRTFEEAAQAVDQTADEARDNTLDLLGNVDTAAGGKSS